MNEGLVFLTCSATMNEDLVFLTCSALRIVGVNGVDLYIITLRMVLRPPQWMNDGLAPQ